jgi:8-oxo-dGTP pyrophosphatase MutT (NUDIX family)
MVENFVVQKTVVCHDDGTYLILRRSSTDTHKPLEWDLPGGLLDPGETLESGAMREVVEEIGSTIAISHLQPRYSQAHMTVVKDKKRNYFMIIYAARVENKNVVLSHEHDFYEWVDAAEFIKRFASQAHYHEAVRYIIDNKLDVLA